MPPGPAQSAKYMGPDKTINNQTTPTAHKQKSLRQTAGGFLQRPPKQVSLVFLAQILERFQSVGVVGRECENFTIFLLGFSDFS